MDFRIDTGGGHGEMTFDKAGDIMNNIYLSLKVRRGAFFQNPAFGSRLHELKKNTANNAALAEDYCKDALQWLIDEGRATGIEVVAERDRLEDIYRLKLHIEATQADGRVIEFETFTEVV